MGYRCEMLDVTNVADVVENSFVVGEKNYVNEYVLKVESVNIDKIKHLCKKKISRDNKLVFVYRNL